jgi:hypothetical protein
LCVSRQRGTIFAKSIDDELQERFTAAGVTWSQLTDFARKEAETAWRWVYGRAFRGRPRLKHGFRADHEYAWQSCDHYLVVPFSTGVAGLPLHVLGRTISAYECCGPLLPLGDYHNAEFFVCPLDLSWTMVHTHKDHALGGPYFIRAEWMPGAGG